ncbi:MAG: c-type cytochrome [Burkholderiales bacterium]|nr:c-type cytochrome [Burkholderiales bacterium]
MNLKKQALTLFSLALLGGLAHAADVDEAAAEAIMKKSGCFKCHSITRDKDGPAYKEIAKKLKGKPDAEQKLYTHLTTNPMVKVEGKEEKHESLKTKDDAVIKNVIAFILSR